MKFRTVFVAFAAALAGFLFGFDTAVISGTIAQIEAQFVVSDVGIGWFVSSALLGAIVGVIFSGYLSDKYGRKTLLVASGLLFMISAMGCAFSMTFNELVMYRIFGGIAFGIASMVAPLYISEMSPASQRGKLVSVYQLAITLGILIAYFSNYWTAGAPTSTTEPLFNFSALVYREERWRGMFLNEVFPALVFLLFLLFVPKSPRWLYVMNKPEKADRVALRYHVKIDKLNTADVAQLPFFKEITGTYKRPMVIAIFLMIFSQFCGINAIIYYGPTILNKAGFAMNEALGGQVTIGLVNTLFTFVAIYTIDKWGRKPLLKFGTTGVILSLLAISFFFFMGNQFTDFVIVGILLFIACYAFSLGPVQFVIASEIFPTKFRGRALTLCTFFMWGSNAVVGQLFPVIMKKFGAEGTFLLFGLICLPALWFIHYKIPETKGKSLEEIQSFWQSKDH
jgi:sugar porter (SP) family MFS transporter